MRISHREKESYYEAVHFYTSATFEKRSLDKPYCIDLNRW